MDITRWSTPNQIIFFTENMEKLYTVSKNKTGR